MGAARTNTLMLDLLQRAHLRWPPSTRPVSLPPPVLEIFEDCVLLKTEADSNKHVKIRDCFDKTGFELLINHIHLRYDGSNETLSSCLEYASLLHDALIPFSSDRQLRIIVSLPENAEFPDADCTVRFHQIRSGEASVADDLDGYKSEAVLVIDVAGPSISRHTRGSSPQKTGRL
jgi:hypothetical protein